MVDASILPVMLAVDDPAIVLWKTSYFGIRSTAVRICCSRPRPTRSFLQTERHHRNYPGQATILRAFHIIFSRLYPNVPTWLS